MYIGTETAQTHNLFYSILQHITTFWKNGFFLQVHKKINCCVLYSDNGRSLKKCQWWYQKSSYSTYRWHCSFYCNWQSSDLELHIVHRACQNVTRNVEKKSYKIMNVLVPFFHSVVYYSISALQRSSIVWHQHMYSLVPSQANQD
jgi:hypothetical protein